MTFANKRSELYCAIQGAGGSDLFYLYGSKQILPIRLSYYIESESGEKGHLIFIDADKEREFRKIFEITAKSCIM